MTLLAGRYEILRPLAEGGMAVVSLAKLVGTSGFAKLVAVKRILRHLAQSDRFAAMFLDEGRVAADLRHPNVVQVLEAGADGDELFIAMELLEGLDAGRLMARVLARGERIAVGLAAQIVLDAAEGLAYAHAKTNLDGEPLEIIHRDISPQNIFITVDGIAKVVDFGIAKARSQTTMTEAGTLKGKCAYMAPEQVCGDPVDHRADQFALGVVLWELITGERLFRRGTDGATLRAVLALDVRAPSTLAGGVPPELDAIVLRALSRDPALRFQNCDALAAALDTMLYTPGGSGLPLRTGRRALAQLVRERVHDAAPAGVPEQTLPSRVPSVSFGDEMTSVDGAPVPIAPAPLMPAPAVGRERAVAAALTALETGAAAGPVTLVGPAGVGKSHLAQVVAAAYGAPGGTFVVEMQGAESESDVVTLLAFTLGLAADALPADLDGAAAAAGRALAGLGRCLVLLDGLDDLRAAATPLAQALAAHAQVLATARVPLGVAGERVISVEPLPVPAADDNDEAILANASVRLLLESAGAPGNEPRALAAVATSTGGLPSALVLAGRWLVERGAAPLAAELSGRVGERPLEVLLDGSLQRLDELAHSALLRLAPHRGPLDREVVDALVPERAPADVVDGLRAQGAVLGDELVPAVRDRALDELAAVGGLHDARVRHAEVVAGLAAAELARIDGAAGNDAARALKRLRPAAEDALEVLLDAAESAAQRTQLVYLALGLDAAVTARSGATPAHLRILDAVLARAGTDVPRSLRARALEARGDHEKLSGRTHEARRDYLLAIELTDGDARICALLERNIADLDLDTGELFAAELHARRAIAAARRARDLRALGRATWTLGRIALKRGQVAEAEVFLETAADVFRKDGDTRFAARATFELGRCAEARGDALGAQSAFAQALAAHEADGDVIFAERARAHLGMVAAWLGDAADARAFLEAARASAAGRGDRRAESALVARLADLAQASRPVPREGPDLGVTS